MGLPSDAHTTIDGLGAAALKKLELARALATQPKLLLADESLNGLDQEMDQAADMLQRIRKEKGITIVWVEHIMGVLMRVVDRWSCSTTARRSSAGARPRRRSRTAGWSRSISAPSAERSKDRGAGRSSADGVDAGYGGFQALFGVSYEVEAGEAVAVIGSNGAGKTTLLRVISGLHAPTAGTMTMEGVDLRHRPAQDRRDRHRPCAGGTPPVSAPDGGGQPAHGRLHPGGARKFAERLDYVYALFPRLKERRAQLAGTMSGGEQQMCAIARALMSGPKLVLLDEPSMGLAPVDRAQVFDLVRRIRAEGYTVLIVEQNVSQVLKVVDRAYLLEVGRIKAAGPAAELAASDDIRKAYMGL